MANGVKGAAPPSVEMLTWSGDNSIKFFVSKKEMRIFDELQMTAELTTEDKTSGKTGYKAVKNSKPYKVTLNALLFASLGVSVRDVATAAMKAVSDAKQGYITLGGKKLLACQFLMTKCAISDIEMTSNGKWVSAKAALTFEQADPAGAGTPQNPPGGGKPKGDGYAGYAVHTYSERNGGQWRILTGKPENASAYVLTVTLNGKKYHGYKPTKTPATRAPTSNRQYGPTKKPTPARTRD